MKGSKGNLCSTGSLFAGSALASVFGVAEEVVVGALIAVDDDLAPRAVMVLALARCRRPVAERMELEVGPLVDS